MSKAKVKEKYAEIQSTPIDKVRPPVGPLDFHDGKSEVIIGGLAYSPVARSVLCYYGIYLIRVIPGDGQSPGRINAVFTDDQGNSTLQLIDNELIVNID